MRIEEQYLKCVFFIGYKAKDGVTRFVGTGFFVAREQGNHPYLVTARHVIMGIKSKSIDGNVLLRINRKDGKVEIKNIHSSKWLVSESEESNDVAVLPWNTEDFKVFDYLLIPESILIKHNMYNPPEFNVGDEIFLTGLFVSHFGEKQNRPVIRVGTLAMLNKEPIKTKYFGEMEAYLVELHSTGGLSGSPVFIRGHFSNPHGIFLLGVIHGHWNSLSNTANDISIEDLSNEPVNMGMAIVVPGTKIIEVVEQHKKALGIISEGPEIITESN